MVGTLLKSRGRPAIQASFCSSRHSSASAFPNENAAPKAALPSRTRGWLRSASPSQQHPDAIQLAVRDAQALPKLHAACPAARLHAELLQPRREPLRAMPSGRPRAISRMAQAADLHLPPAGAFDQFDLDFLHRRAPLILTPAGTAPAARPSPASPPLPPPEYVPHCIMTCR